MARIVPHWLPVRVWLVFFFLPPFSSPLPYDCSNCYTGHSPDDGKNGDTVLDVKRTDQPPLNGHNAHSDNQV